MADLPGSPLEDFTLDREDVNFPQSNLAKNNFVTDARNMADTPGSYIGDPIRRDYNSLWERRPGSSGWPQIFWGRSTLGGVNMPNFTLASSSPSLLPPSSQNPFGALVENISLVGRHERFLNHDSWIDYINQVESIREQQGGKYLDHTIVYGTPFTALEASRLDGNLPHGSLLATTRFDYSFYMKNYETVAASAPEQLLPDLYTFYLEKDRQLNDETAFNSVLAVVGEGSLVGVANIADAGSDYDTNYLYSDFITLNRSIPQVFMNTYNFRPTAAGPAFVKLGEQDRGEYYDKWARKYSEILLSPLTTDEEAAARAGVVEIGKKYRNVLMTLPALKYAQTNMNSFKELFPMFTEINLPCTSPNQISDKMTEQRIAKNVMHSLLADSVRFSQGDANYTSTVNFIQEYRRVGSDGAQHRFLLDEEVAGATRSVFDLEAWLDQTSTQINNLTDMSGDFASTEGAEFALLNRKINLTGGIFDEFPSVSMLESALSSLESRITELCADNLRSYRQLLGGATAYSEDLFFQIIKYRTLPGGLVDSGPMETRPSRNREFIQNYFIPNGDEDTVNTVFELIDTQNQYGQEYEYEVFTHRIVIGSESNISPILWSTSPPGGPESLDLGPLSDEEQEYYDRYGSLLPDNHRYDPATDTVYVLVNYEDIEAIGYEPDYDDLPPAGGSSSSTGVYATGGGTPFDDSKDDDDGLADFTGAADGLDSYFNELGTGRREYYNRYGHYLPPGYIYDPDEDEVLEVVEVASSSAAAGDSPFDEPDGPPEIPAYTANFTVTTRPSVKIIRLPFLSYPVGDSSFSRGTFLDDPPVPPEVDVIPYKGINNRLLFNLTSGFGENFLEPVSFSNEEEEYINRIKTTRSIIDFNPNESRILYENDDLTKEFEVRRIVGRMPKSYEDFRDLAEVFRSSTAVERDFGFRAATSTSFIDTIAPNVPSYYVFRSFDIHGHASYPSAVYEVILRDNSGAVYPEISVIDLPKLAERRPTSRVMRRFLQIKPQVTQVDYRPSPIDPSTGESPVSAPLGSDLPIGSASEKIWGKKFKIRLTSKQTGRKIDLNLNFEKEYDSDRVAEYTIGGVSPDTLGLTPTAVVDGGRPPGWVGPWPPSVPT